jgi:tRNA dimethylallyltransferase
VVRTNSAIVGPTGSGKSQVALALSGSDGEIVSCDSVQVYRGFVIGCAKPSAEELGRVPHHLVDVAEWNEPFDAARYRTLATRALAEIEQRGRRPIVCGGTGLYLRVLRWGLVDAPRADPALRRELLAQEHAGPGTLFCRLEKLDPQTTRKIEPHNLVHIVRALEITLQTGEPASAFRGRHGFQHEALPMRVVALRWPR